MAQVVLEDVGKVFDGNVVAVKEGEHGASLLNRNNIACG